MAAVILIRQSGWRHHSNSESRISKTKYKIGKRFKQIYRSYQQDFFMNVVEFIVKLNINIIRLKELGISTAKNIKFRENFYRVTLLAERIKSFKRKLYIDNPGNGIVVTIPLNFILNKFWAFRKSGGSKE